MTQPQGVSRVRSQDSLVVFEGAATPALGAAVAKHAIRLRKTSDAGQPHYGQKPLSPAVLDAISADLDRALAPAGPEPAARTARLLVGLYPVSRPHDPETYLRGIAAILAEAPPWAGEAAVKRLHRSCQYPPTGAELVKALDDVLRNLNRFRHGLFFERMYAREHEHAPA